MTPLIEEPKCPFCGQEWYNNRVTEHFRYVGKNKIRCLNCGKTWKLSNVINILKKNKKRK